MLSNANAKQYRIERVWDSFLLLEAIGEKQKQKMAKWKNILHERDYCNLKAATLKIITNAHFQWHSLTISTAKSSPKTFDTIYWAANFKYY